MNTTNDKLTLAKRDPVAILAYAEIIDAATGSTPADVKAALAAAAKAEPHPLDIPEALKLTPEQRTAARNMPLPRSAPGREMAVPQARKMPTKAQLEAKAKKLGLSMKGTSVPKNAKKAKTTKTSPARKTTAGEPKKGSKVALIAGMLRRRGGCTTSDVLQATGWPSVSMPQQAALAGIKLVKTKDAGKPTRYTAG